MLSVTNYLYIIQRYTMMDRRLMPVGSAGLSVSGSASSVKCLGTQPLRNCM